MSSNFPLEKKRKERKKHIYYGFIMSFKVQDAIRKLFGRKSGELPKTRSTPVLNHNNTSEMERHSVVNLLQESCTFEVYRKLIAVNLIDLLSIVFNYLYTRLFFR